MRARRDRGEHLHHADDNWQKIDPPPGLHRLAEILPFVVARIEADPDPCPPPGHDPAVDLFLPPAQRSSRESAA